jgi:hypothetical protein
MKYQTLAEYNREAKASDGDNTIVEGVYSYTTGKEEALGTVTNTACGHDIYLDEPTFTESVVCPTCGVPFASK